MKTYELFLSDEDLQGIDAISVVGSPAMESRFIALADEKKVQFAKIDNEKKILLGVALIPEKKIYRFDEKTKEEYYVYFSKETIKRASELYLKKGNQSNANLEHSKLTLNGTIVESWIVEDLEKDKTALYGIDAPVGSWVVAMKIEDEEQWQMCKDNGSGFSIEGMFDEKVTLNKENMNFNQMKDDLLNEFKTLLGKQIKLAEWKTEDGSLTLVTETEMPEIGGTISVATPDGNVPAPIGDYILNDGTTISVSEVGIIGEISTQAEEAAPVEEMAAPAPASVNTNEVSDLKNAISSMLIKFQEINEQRFSAIETKLSEQVKENETLKVELSETPAVTKTKVAPIEAATEKPRTLKGRLALSLTELKNKN
tara:strand:- start:78 stop:1184 length:1107 start_codon:yes stop_codon:yes gene_type:complete